MAKTTGPKLIRQMEDAAGACAAEEVGGCSPTFFEQARRTRDSLQEALNNLESAQYRLRTPPPGDCSDPQKICQESLEDLLTDCNYLARRLVSVSQELSGIIGE